MNAASPKEKSAIRIRESRGLIALVVRATVRRLWRRYQRSVAGGERERRLQEYREAKGVYERELFAAKMRSWDTFVGECLQTNVWGIPYKIAAEKIHPPALLSTLRAEGGGMTRDWRKSASVLLEALLPSDDPTDETQEQMALRGVARTL